MKSETKRAVVFVALHDCRTEYAGSPTASDRDHAQAWLDGIDECLRTRCNRTVMWDLQNNCWGGRLGQGFLAFCLNIAGEQETEAVPFDADGD